MPDNDFLYSLRDNVPEDFKQQLKQQLDAQEPDKTPVSTNHSTWWTVAVASIVTLILSVGILVNNQDTLPFMKPLLPPPDLSESPVISAHNINQLHKRDPIGLYSNDFATYKDKVIIGTFQGIFEHNATNLNAEPRMLVEDTAFDVAVDGQGNVFYQQSSADYTQVLVYRWDRQTNTTRQIQTLDVRIIAPDSLYVSEDGQSLYINECILDSADKMPYVDCAWELRGYDVASGEQFVSYALNSWVYKISQSQDGEWLFYFSYDVPQANVYLNQTNMNTRDHNTILYSSSESSYPQWVTFETHLAVSDNGQKILIRRSPALPVNIWDISELLGFDTTNGVADHSDGKNFSLRNSSNPTFDSTGDFLIQSDDWIWYVYDIRDNVTINGYPIEVKTFEKIEFSNDGAIAIGSYNGIFYAYDTNRWADDEGLKRPSEADPWEPREILTRYARSGDSLSFTADGKTLVTDQTLTLWDLSTSSPTAQIMPTVEDRVQNVRHAVISPDGQYIAYQPYDSSPVGYGRVYVKNLATNKSHFIDKLVTPMSDMRFLPDNTLVITSDRGVIYQIPPEKLDIDTEEDSPYTITQVEEVQLTTDNNIRNMPITFTADGQLATLWDCENYDADTKLCEETTLHIWDIANEQSILEIADDHIEQPGYIAFSPDGQQLAFSFCTEIEMLTEYFPNCLSSEVRVYEVDALLNSGNTEPFAAFNTSGATALTYHPHQQSDDSFILALTDTSNDGGTQFWSVATDGQTNLLSTESEIRMPFVFNPQGDQIVTQNLNVWGNAFNN